MKVQQDWNKQTRF